MKKCYAVCDFLTEVNKKEMKATALECGYEIEFFERNEDASGRVSDGEVIYSDGPELLGQMPQLRWCHTAFAGVGPYIESGVFDSGEVILTNSSGAYGRTISEHIIMVTLMLMRQMPGYNKIISGHRWVQGIPMRSIADSNIVILGTGDIGRNAARRFKALGAKRVTGFNRSGRQNPDFDAVYSLADFDSVIGTLDVDVLVLCIPGTPESKGLLSAERIAVLPQKTFVVNVGRGSVIDQDALLTALNERKIAGAALDVVYPEPLPADHPLWSAPGVIITPHISGDMSLPYTVDKTVEFFCENLRLFVRGEELINKVDIKAGY